MKTLPSLNHAATAPGAGKNGGKAMQGHNSDASFAKLLHAGKAGETHVAQRRTDADTMKSRIDDRSNARSLNVKPDMKIDKPKAAAPTNVDSDAPDPVKPAGDEAVPQTVARTETVALPIFALRLPVPEARRPSGTSVEAPGNDQPTQPEASSEATASVDAPVKAERSVAPGPEISASTPQPAVESNEPDVVSSPKVVGVPFVPKTEEPLPQPTVIQKPEEPQAHQTTAPQTAPEPTPAMASRTREQPMASPVRQSLPPAEPLQRDASSVETAEANPPKSVQPAANTVSISHTEVTIAASPPQAEDAQVDAPPVIAKADNDVNTPAAAKSAEPIAPTKPIIQDGATPPIVAKIVLAPIEAAMPHTPKAPEPAAAARPKQSENAPIHLEKIVVSEAPATSVEDTTPPQKPSAAPSPPSFAAELTRAATRYSFLPAASRTQATETAAPSDNQGEPSDTAQPPAVGRPAFGSTLGALAQPPQAVGSASAHADDLGPVLEERPNSSARTSDDAAPERADSTVEQEKRASVPTSTSSGPASANAVTPSNAVQTPSPATSVASAIIAEPSWRPASVASPTQSPLDRIANTAKTLSVQLNPGSLGVVTATLSMSGGQLKVHLSAESGEAHERLKSESHTIEKAMRSLGYEVSEIVIAQSPIVSPSITKPDSSAVGHPPAGREPQSQGSNGSAGERSAGQNGERNGNGGISNSGGHAPRPADRSPGGVYI